MRGKGSEVLRSSDYDGINVLDIRLRSTNLKETSTKVYNENSKIQ